MSAINFLSNPNMILLILSGISIVIGVAVSQNIQETESDKVKGDKRLVATIFIMSSLIFMGILWARKNCSERIPSLI